MLFPIINLPTSPQLFFSTANVRIGSQTQKGTKWIYKRSRASDIYYGEHLYLCNKICLFNIAFLQFFSSSRHVNFPFQHDNLRELDLKLRSIQLYLKVVEHLVFSGEWRWKQDKTGFGEAFGSHRHHAAPSRSPPASPSASFFTTSSFIILLCSYKCSPSQFYLTLTSC
jgi:hypothetical protein